MTDFHPIQITILQKLMYSDGLRFVEIKPPKMEGSKFTFHLSKLVQSGIIRKVNQKYFLTPLGKDHASGIDLGDTYVKSQAKISVFIVCYQNNKYLLYTRQKTPFYGYQGFPTGKVKKGENILLAAKRELKEETNLVGTPQLFAVRHYKVYSKDKILLEDKIYFACKFTNVKGDLKSGPEGKYKWVKEDEVWNYLKNPVPEVGDILNSVHDTSISFSEKEYIGEGF
jgi:ADP-ribose pyrophosphatase YjhB (NUDIX family)